MNWLSSRETERNAHEVPARPPSAACAHSFMSAFCPQRLPPRAPITVERRDDGLGKIFPALRGWAAIMTDAIAAAIGTVGHVDSPTKPCSTAGRSGTASGPIRG